MQPLASKQEWAERRLPPGVLKELQPIIDRAAQSNNVVTAKSVPLRYSVIFSGPAGSGKKMAAAQLSETTGIPVYIIKLSEVVSKYIGETEKNLERLFKAAEQTKCILFFDEADALFGKRTEVKDAHDRYANVEVNYLLQLIKNYNGIVVIASANKSALDEAFIRRFNQVITFPAERAK